MRGQRRQALLPGEDRACECRVRGKQALSLAALVTIERAEHVFGGEQIAVLFAAHDARHPRNCVRLRLIHDFTVPSGS